MESLFNQAIDAKGAQYVEVRQNLLSQPHAREYLLKTIVTCGDEQRKWIAEILLERARDPVRFRKLEEAFCDKVIVLHECFPHTNHAGIPVYDMSTIGLLLPNEPVPYVLPQVYRRAPDMTAAMDWYFKFIRMEDSQPWRLMLAETALKGFGAKDYWLPMQARSPQRMATADQRGIRLYNSDFGAMFVTPDFFAGYAMLALGKLGENRIGPIAARRAADESLEVRERIWAVRTLRLLGDPGAASIFVRIVQKENATEVLSRDAVNALGDLGDEGAISVLQQLLHRPELGESTVFERKMVEASVKDAISKIKKRVGVRP